MPYHAKLHPSSGRIANEQRREAKVCSEKEILQRSEAFRRTGKMHSRSAGKETRSSSCRRPHGRAREGPEWRRRGRRPSGRCGPAEKGKGAARPPGKRGRGLPAPPLRAPCPSRGRTRPARARRPVLPQTGSAVLWAMAGLAAEFGMGSGDPRLRGRARAGRPLRFPSGTSRAPWRPHSVVRETSSSRDRPPREPGVGKQELGLLVPLA